MGVGPRTPHDPSLLKGGNHPQKGTLGFDPQPYTIWFLMVFLTHCPASGYTFSIRYFKGMGPWPPNHQIDVQIMIHDLLHGAP